MVNISSSSEFSPCSLEWYLKITRDDDQNRSSATYLSDEGINYYIFFLQYQCYLMLVLKNIFVLTFKRHESTFRFLLLSQFGLLDESIHLLIHDVKNLQENYNIHVNGFNYLTTQKLRKLCTNLRMFFFALPGRFNFDFIAKCPSCSILSCL